MKRDAWPWLALGLTSLGMLVTGGYSIYVNHQLANEQNLSARIYLWNNQQQQDMQARLNNAQNNIQVLESISREPLKQEELKRVGDQCLRQLGECRQVIDTTPTTTMYYALTPGKAILEEENSGRALFSIVEYDSMVREKSRKVIGFYQVPNREPLELERLPSGLYRLHGVVDFTEGGYGWYLYININTAEGLAVAGGEGNNGFAQLGRHIIFPQGSSGNFMANLVVDDCDTKEQAEIHLVTWNRESVFKFSPPLKIGCTSNELGGGISAFFLKGSEVVSGDLQSVTLPMANGKSLLVKPVGDSVSVTIQ